MNINKENLLRMADHIEKVPQEMFDMDIFRSGSLNPRECKSVGCVIGHCTILDTEKNIGKFRYSWGGINFFEWSKGFTGINDEADDIWQYLFGEIWVFSDNTPAGAAARIRYFVENGLPETWQEEMRGNAPLSYKVKED